MNNQAHLLSGNKNTALIKNSQMGAVLVTSLVILLVMTLIGLTGMQVSSLEEKMAGNMRNRNLAFQAAESALREAENDISNNKPECFGGTNGCYPSNSGIGVFINPVDDTNWSGINEVDYSGGTLANVSQVPKYIVQEIQVDDGSSLDASVVPQVFYRVTARGTGGTTTAVTIVQSVYKR